jgi:hypothetical protein
MIDDIIVSLESPTWRTRSRAIRPAILPPTTPGPLMPMSPDHEACADATHSFRIRGFCFVIGIGFLLRDQHRRFVISLPAAVKDQRHQTKADGQ